MRNKKILALIMALLLMLTNVVSAKTLEEVISEKKVEFVKDKEISIGIESLSKEKVGDFKVEITGPKLEIKFLKGIDIKDVDIKGLEMSITLNTDDPVIIAKVRASIDEYNKLYENKQNVDKFIRTKNDDSVINIDIIPSEESNKAEKDKEVKDNNDNKETPSKDNDKQIENKFLDKISEFKLDKDVTAYIKDLFTNKGKEKDKKDILDKIADFKLDPNVTKEIKDLYSDYLKEKAESDLLDKIGDYKLDPNVTGDIKDIFAKDIQERKEAEELIKKIEGFNLDEKVVNEIADLYKEYLARIKETEILEKAADFKLDPDVTGDIKDIFKEAIKDEEIKKKLLDAADYKLDPDVVNDVKDMFKGMFDTPDEKPDEPKEPEKPFEETSRSKDFNSGKMADDAEFRAEFLRLINEERAKQGKKPLEYSEKLRKGTDLRANELAEFGYLRTGENIDQKHTRPDGKSSFRTAFDYLENYEDRQGGNLGENTLMRAFASRKYGKDTLWNSEAVPKGTTIEQALSDPKLLAATVYEQWKASPGHYQNMMYDDYKTFWVSVSLGEGLKEKDGTKDKTYDVLLGVTVFDIYDEAYYNNLNNGKEKLVTPADNEKPAEATEENKEEETAKEPEEAVKTPEIKKDAEEPKENPVEGAEKTGEEKTEENIVEEN